MTYRKIHRRIRFCSFVGAVVSLISTEPAIAERLKVAFIGDQGIAPTAQRVLELIRDEQTELLLIQGDLGYEPEAAAQWIRNIDTILGKDFPVLMVVGNHENYEWPTYLQWQKDKLESVPAIRCEGDVSVKAYCTYKNLGVVQVSPGIIEVEGIDGNDDYAGYITEKFSEDNSIWRICSWHKNMRDMQVGAKGDSTGWGVYQNCLAQGAIVVNGHEHSYSRTHLMSSFEDKTVIHTDNDMDIGTNSSVAIVSGLGGRQIRPQMHGGDWFASIYTASQNANDGALFCEFDEDKADCYMKDVAGLVPDSFTLSSLINVSAEPSTSATGSTQDEPVSLNETVEPDANPQSEDTTPTSDQSGAPAEPPETAEQAEPVPVAPDNPAQVPQTVISTPDEEEQTSDSLSISPTTSSAQIPTVFLDNVTTPMDPSAPVTPRHVKVDGGGLMDWLSLLSMFIASLLHRFNFIQFQPNKASRSL